MKPKSPIRVVTNAFLPATAAARRSNQKETRRYEQQPDALPPEERHEEARAEHEDQHRGDEQVHVREEAREARVAVHVADAKTWISVAIAGDEEDERHRERVDEEAHLHLQPTRRQPREQVLHVGPLVGGQVEEREERDDRPDEGQPEQPAARSIRRSARRAACRTASGSPRPTIGSSGTIQTRSSRSRLVTAVPPDHSAGSAPECPDIVGGGALPAAEDRHDDGEADGDLGRGDDEREEHDHLARDVVRVSGRRRRT